MFEHNTGPGWDGPEYVAVRDAGRYRLLQPILEFFSQLLTELYSNPI